MERLAPGIEWKVVKKREGWRPSIRCPCPGPRCRFLRVHGSPTRAGRVSGLFGEEAKGAGRRGASVDERRPRRRVAPRDAAAGQPTGPPPWPDYLDHTYRRQSAARFLGKRAAGSAECLGPLVFVAAHDEDEEVRLACLEVLFGSGWPGLEAFMVALSFDSSDEVRRLALEALGLLARRASSHRAASAGGPRPGDPREGRAMLADESWQRWRL